MTPTNRTLRIALFTAASLGWSFVWLVARPYAPWTAEAPALLRLIVGWGAPLGGLAAALWLRQALGPNRPTLLGRAPLWSLVIAGAPVLAVVPVGLSGIDGLPSPLTGAVVGVVVVGYALLEEWGWRGYLQEELGLEKRVLSALAVTCFWYPWHWWFLSDTASVGRQLFLFAVLVASSAGIGEISRITRSVLACSAFHAIGNLVLMFPWVANQLTGAEKIFVLAFCVTVWVFAVRRIVIRGVPS